MAECWHSDSKSPTIAGVSSDSLTDRYCLTDIHRPHIWSWQLEDSNLDSNNLDSLAGLQMCTWARVGLHGHETDLCRMEDRSWWCWNAVCAILTFYFCLDYCYVTVGTCTQRGLGSAKQRHWVVCFWVLSTKSEEDLDSFWWWVVNLWRNKSFSEE